MLTIHDLGRSQSERDMILRRLDRALDLVEARLAKGDPGLTPLLT